MAKTEIKVRRTEVSALQRYPEIPCTHSRDLEPQSRHRVLRLLCQRRRQLTKKPLSCPQPLAIAHLGDILVNYLGKQGRGERREGEKRLFFFPSPTARAPRSLSIPSLPLRARSQYPLSRQNPRSLGLGKAYGGRRNPVIWNSFKAICISFPSDDVPRLFTTGYLEFLLSRESVLFSLRVRESGRLLFNITDL